MGSLFRSEEMTLRQLILPPEAAFRCLAELGELGLVQFNDLNPNTTSFTKKFVNEIRRCDEMERKLKFLENEATADKIPVMASSDNPEAPNPKEMASIEVKLESLEQDMNEIIANTQALRRNFLELSLLKHLLRKTHTFFTEAAAQTTLVEFDDSARLLSNAESLSYGFTAGVIARQRMASFERLLWRACSGNVFLRQSEIDVPLKDPVTGEDVHYSAFVIFSNGSRLKSRVKKICDGFQTTMFPCPESADERREMAIGVMTRIEDLNTVLSQTESHRRRTLVSAAQLLRTWTIKVRKIKAIYFTLNMFNLDATQKCLLGECWCPVKDLDKIQMALRRGMLLSESDVVPILSPMATKMQPPTYFETNKFTSAFQMIVESYGVASYQEVNPTPFTIISFPFLFGVMFGDAGHGTIVMLLAAWIIWNERKYLEEQSDDEIWNIMFGGRYIIFLMGFFSTYAGLMYNDVFSKGLNIFGSAWYPNPEQFSGPDAFAKETYITLDPAKDYSGSPYPFGIDPIWMLAINKIVFLNSYKMKLSVTLGISQMVFGVMLSIFNHRYFKKSINIFCEFLPQLIFLVSIFVYLIVLIFYKWLAYNAATSNCAPSLLIHFINMFLLTYVSTPCDAATFYPGQQVVQTMLLILALLCVPWLLLLKPLILRHQHLQRTQGLSVRADGSSVTYRSYSSEDDDKTPAYAYSSVTLEIATPDQDAEEVKVVKSGPEDVDNEEFALGEVMILQAIHTIEYCLGCVSHTASYLRLWALSLAHAQLSEVLWTMVMRIGLTIPGWLGAPVAFAIFMPWALLTVAILLLMEGLSAFLHTLRLHWVEFQSKFYHGEGYAFNPFSFKKQLAINLDGE